MESKTVARRRHSRELKSEVLAACAEPGASVAAVALAHGLNANLVHKWRTGKDCGPASAGSTTAVGEFIALALPTPAAPAPAHDIRIELRRGASAVTVSWPVSAAAECAVWLGQWLK